MRWQFLEGTGLKFEMTPHPEFPAQGKYWPVACANFKRPFGDMSNFSIDMANILGRPSKKGANDPEEDRLYELFDQMHIALQVFVMNAEV